MFSLFFYLCISKKLEIKYKDWTEIQTECFWQEFIMDDMCFVLCNVRKYIILVHITFSDANFDH